MDTHWRVDYTNDGVKKDVFKITETGTAQYTFGPSLTLSGKEASSTLSGEDASFGVSGDDVQAKNGWDNGKQLGQVVNGQGKGLDWSTSGNKDQSVVRLP